MERPVQKSVLEIFFTKSPCVWLPTTLAKGRLVRGVIKLNGNRVAIKVIDRREVEGNPRKVVQMERELNIVMKLMAVLSLVFADYFYSINDGTGVFKTN